MANGPILGVDLALFKAGRFTAAKLMHYHTAQDVQAVQNAAQAAGAGKVRITVRLPEMPRPENAIDLPDTYAATCEEVINRLYPAGVLDYQVDVEPQYTYNEVQAGPWQYQFYLRRAIANLRNRLQAQGKAGVRLLSPPLSWAPNLWHNDANNPTPFTLDDWLKAFDFRENGDGPSLWEMFDATSADCYWQSANQMKDASFGANFVTVHQHSGLPVAIVECGNSLRDKQPRPAPDVIEQAQTADYPAYLAYLKTFPFVESCHFFLLGGQGWDGFYLSETICEAISTVQP